MTKTIILHATNLSFNLHLVGKVFFLAFRAMPNHVVKVQLLKIFEKVFGC